MAIEGVMNLIYDRVYYLLYSRSIADEHMLCHVSSECDSHPRECVEGLADELSGWVHGGHIQDVSGKGT